VVSSHYVPNIPCTLKKETDHLRRFERRRVERLSWEDEVAVKGGPLMVGEVLIWKSLKSAVQFLSIHRENLVFWSRIRAVFLDYVGPLDQQLELRSAN
jgi:hypothetical protein